MRRTRTFMISTILGVFLSLLPVRYRSHFGWEAVPSRSAVISGVLELVGCLGILLWRYIEFANRRVVGMPDEVTLGAVEQGGQTALMGMGLFVLAEYLVQPLTLLILYFAIEGLTRMAAAIVSAEIVPTLPLQLVSLAHGAALRKKKERDLGPLVEDIVQKGSGEFALTIATCRPRPWSTMTTIEYAGQMYELVSEQKGVAPRRWIYVLRKRPESKIVRGLYRYQPDELVRELMKKEAPQEEEVLK